MGDPNASCSISLSVTTTNVAERLKQLIHLDIVADAALNSRLLMLEESDEVIIGQVLSNLMLFVVTKMTEADINFVHPNFESGFALDNRTYLVLNLEDGEYYIQLTKRIEMGNRLEISQLKYWSEENDWEFAKRLVERV